mgnify:CR=1 FL=1
MSGGASKANQRQSKHHEKKYAAQCIRTETHTRVRREKRERRHLHWANDRVYQTYQTLRKVFLDRKRVEGDTGHLTDRYNFV